MRLMGDTYVKDEFRRHKNCSQEQSLIFLKEWTDYCMMLSKQLSNKGIVKGELGKPLEARLLEKLEDEQLMQLFELKCEAEKWGQGNFEEEEIKVKEGS
uniref:Succinate dehydrogenase assembly factor 3 n=1 Tax=Acrobeloides nanus TaxID=290746 RepID=A0A914DPV2_9BILA